MLIEADGGYDQGYRAVRGFWGTEPGSLVSEFLSLHDPAGMIVIDVGAGEGKNAAAFARGGAVVEALECSSVAIQNGKSLFSDLAIAWIQTDALEFIYPRNHYDVIICYGLIHCLHSEAAAGRLMDALKSSLKPGGTLMLVSFNDGSHDLSAHPGFQPLLLKHEWFESLFEGWTVTSSTDSILFETHPHNQVPHHHSMTRISAVKI